MKFFPHTKLFAESIRLIVRPYKLSDHKLIVKSLQERLPQIDEFDEVVGTASIKNYAQFKKKVLGQRESFKKKRGLVFGVFDKNEEHYFGQVDFFVINEQLRWGNIGYWIHNQHRGNGYATEACELALELGFNKCNFHRIEAGTEKRNKASIKVMKKLPLIFEGERKKFFPNDGGIDMIFYAANSIDFIANH